MWFAQESHHFPVQITCDLNGSNHNTSAWKRRRHLIVHTRTGSHGYRVFIPMRSSSGKHAVFCKLLLWWCPLLKPKQFAWTRYYGVAVRNALELLLFPHLISVNWGLMVKIWLKCASDKVQLSVLLWGHIHTATEDCTHYRCLYFGIGSRPVKINVSLRGNVHPKLLHA